MVPAPPAAPGAPLVVWDDAMLGYDLGGRHPLHPLRWELTWSLARQLGVLDGVTLFAPRAATDAELTTVHEPDFVAAVRARSVLPDPLRPRGFGLDTADNPTFGGMHQSAALIAGGSIQAARAIAAGTVRRAVNIAGGLHHAMADRASGFCVYNDAALAIRAMLDAGVERVAYIDTDVHHGDGVQAAFETDPRVLTVSVHESPATLWPGTGWADETGTGAGQGFAVNLPLPAGSGDSDWLAAFTAVVPSVLRAFRPQVLVSQHGVDSHAEDPLADLNLSVDGHAAIAGVLRELSLELTDGRWLVLGGGGYALVRVVPRSWTRLLATVLDRDLDPATPTPAGWREQARAARPRIEPPTGMGDGGPVAVPAPAWTGDIRTPVDRAVADVRAQVFPAFGLDPFDPRD